MAPGTRTVLFAAVLLLGFAACSDDDGASDPSPSSTQTSGSGGGSTSTGPGSDGSATTQADGGGAPTFTSTVVAEMDVPIALLPRPGDDLLWVAERGGTVRRVEKASDGRLEPAGEPVLDISDQTTTDGERGLLGMAFSTDGSVLYVSHTDTEGTSKVAAYDVADDAVDVGSRRELLSVEQPFPNHNGGHVVVTDDDVLWLGLGDGGSRDDPENRAQDPDTLLGKLVRVDTSGGGDHEIVASGLRNPWRFSFEPDGSVWIADVGQNAIEEINRIPADDLEGANFGWSGYEGAEPYLDGEGRRPADAVMPLFTYTHDGGNCSITGGFTYKGPVESFAGSYLFADLCAERVRAVLATDDGYTETDLGVDVVSPISFGTDADDEVYVLSASGSIVRIDVA